MKRDEIKKHVKLHLPIIVKNRNGRLIYPHKNQKVSDVIVDNMVSLIEKILSNERGTDRKHEQKKEKCVMVKGNVNCCYMCLDIPCT